MAYSVLAGLKSGFSIGDPRVYSSHDKQTALWTGGIDELEIWQAGWGGGHGKTQLLKRVPF